jgi:hypothetical protein
MHRIRIYLGKARPSGGTHRTLSDALDNAHDYGITVLSMKRDWNVMFDRLNDGARLQAIWESLPWTQIESLSNNNHWTRLDIQVTNPSGFVTPTSQAS